jgi:hypothetical protein
MKDKAGNFILQDVPCPHDCTAIISPISIQVPTKFKSKEGSQYVDMISRKNPDGSISYRFVYIVPKKYCYLLHQTALVLSWNKLRRFYSGVMLSMQNGSNLFMYIIPYNPNAQSAGRRVLHCKASVDYSTEIQMLKDFWIKNNIIFNPAWCQLDDFVKGRDNMAILNLDSTEDMFERFDASKPLGEDDTFEEVDFLDE